MVDRFGEKLRALRMHKRLTLREMGRRLGYRSHSYLSELESGKKIPTVQFVLKVARLFDVTTDELIKDELEVSSLDPDV